MTRAIDLRLIIWAVFALMIGMSSALAQTSTSGSIAGSSSGVNADNSSSSTAVGSTNIFPNAAAATTVREDSRQTRKLYGNPDFSLLTPQSTAPCYVVAGGAGSGGLIGAAVNVPFFDSECNDRFWFINLHQAGLTSEAITYLCFQQEKMAKIFGENCGEIAGHARPDASNGYEYVALTATHRMDQTNGFQQVSYVRESGFGRADP